MKKLTYFVMTILAMLCFVISTSILSNDDDNIWKIDVLSVSGVI